MCETQFSNTFQAKRDNTKLTGKGGGKDDKYKKMDLLTPDILGKDNSSVEGLFGDKCFQADETVVDQHQAKIPTSILLADILSAPSVRY